MSALDRLILGDGELVKRVRQIDWSSYEVGESDSWSPSVQTAIALCMASRTPMQLWLGRSLTLIYNDAAIPMIASHPDALGRSVPDVMGERFRTIRSEVDRVFTERVALTTDTLVLTPLLGTDGEVVGVACTPTEKVTQDGLQHISTLLTQLRTPLTLVLGPLDELLTSKDDPILAPREDVERIHRGAIRLCKLLGAVLHFSRIETDHAYATFEPTPLAEMTREIADGMRSAIEGANISLVVDCTLDEMVYVDPHLWEQVVLDLLANALDVTLEGQITVTLRREDDRAVLIVGDGGTAIPAEELPRVFDRFQQRRPAGARTGDGTRSLALVRELVDHNGGTIEVESTSAPGNRFVIKLPFGSEHLPVAQVRHESGTSRPTAATSLYASDAASWWTPARGDTVAADTSRQRILIADDNADMREYMARMLGDEFVIDQASDGYEAMTLAASNTPDLVLADLMMPGLDGVGVLRGLRGAPQTSHIPVILVTARTSEEARASGLEAGADDYLVKPFTTRELRARVRTQLELSRVRREATQRADRAKDDFLAMVGHELRNPLSTVGTMLQALMLRTPTREIELMERAVRQLTRLVEDLLESSRLSRGKIEMQTRVVELAQVVDRAMEIVGSQFEDKHNKVTVSVPRVGCRVEADAERLARAISNVLMNATHHSPAGTRITVEVQRMEERMRLRILDEGPGIAADRLGGVFEAFREDRSSGGLGLGLAIARRIVELHGGAINVQSAGAGTGTECIIELPTTSLAANDTQPITRVTRKRLLLVEDNDDAARALKTALEQLGYVVALAHDGPVAINLAKSFKPDVALLDLGLPVMDGWELAQRLRHAVTELPIVAVTARDQEADKQKSAAIGFADHLVKPIDLTQLERVVEGLPGRNG